MAEFDLRRLYDRTLPGTARSADQPACHDWQGGWSALLSIHLSRPAASDPGGHEFVHPVEVR